MSGESNIGSLAERAARLAGAWSPGESLRLAWAAGDIVGGALDVVGLALVAYRLVRLVARVVARLRRRPAPAPTPGASHFTERDRERLERACELMAGMERLQRAIREVRDETRRLAEERARLDPRGEEW